MRFSSAGSSTRPGSSSPQFLRFTEMVARTACVAAGLALALIIGRALADEPFPAHRVAGNVYYVGSKALATYLIVTPEGHFLINSGFEETVPLIRVAVESLGF